MPKTNIINDSCKTLGRKQMGFILLWILGKVECLSSPIIFQASPECMCIHVSYVTNYTSFATSEYSIMIPISQAYRFCRYLSENVEKVHCKSNEIKTETVIFVNEIIDGFSSSLGKKELKICNASIKDFKKLHKDPWLVHQDSYSPTKDLQKENGGQNNDTENNKQK